jgi:hypothetical protein
VQKIEHNALLARVKSLESKLNTVQGIADKAITAANKAKK